MNANISQEPYTKTHPGFIARRMYLRNAVNAADQVPQVTRAAATGLWNMSDALLAKLWELVLPMIELARLQNNRRSPMWRERIRTRTDKAAD